MNGINGITVVYAVQPEDKHLLPEDKAVESLARILLERIRLRRAGV